MNKPLLENALRSALKAGMSQSDVEIEARWKVSRGEFQTLKTFYDRSLLPCTYHILCDRIFLDGIRSQTSFLDDVTIWIKKKVVTTTRTELACKLVLSQEKMLKQQPASLSPQPILKRSKDRWSYLDTSIRIDLTIVSIEQRKEFEIEVEVIDPKEKHLVKRFLYSCTKIRDLLAKFARDQNSLSKVIGPNFCGALPKTLHQSDLPSLQANYCISLKLDGERRLFMMQKETEYITVFDRNMSLSEEIKLEAPLQNNSIIVFDVEKIDGIFIILDVIIMNKVDMRIADLSLLERIHICRNFLTSNKLPANILLKNYYTDLETLDYDQNQQHKQQFISDGYIFTKNHAPYSKQSRDSELFKWKPLMKQTIDFRIKILNSAPKLYLTYDTSENEFLPEACFSFNSDMISVEHDEIIECSWNPITVEWTAVRKRIDKKKPNYISTAEDIWSYYFNPVTELDISHSLGHSYQLTPYQPVSEWIQVLQIYLEEQHQIQLLQTEIPEEDINVKGFCVVADCRDLKRKWLTNNKNSVYIVYPEKDENVIHIMQADQCWIGRTHTYFLKSLHASTASQFSDIRLIESLNQYPFIFEELMFFLK